MSNLQLSQTAGASPFFFCPRLSLSLLRSDFVLRFPAPPFLPCIKHPTSADRDAGADDNDDDDDNQPPVS